MASRLISAADLITADFPDVADEWAQERGLIKTSQEITTETFSYTGDVDKIYLMDSTEDQTVTIKQNLTNVPIGTVITFVRMNTGQVTLVPEGSVVINSTTGDLSIGNQYGAIQLLKLGENLFLVLTQ